MNPVSGAARRWLYKLLLASASILITLGVAELVLRATWSTEQVTLVHDPLLGFRGRGGARTIWHREMSGQPRMVQLNEAGYHDHPRQRVPPPGTRRLVFLGDSFLEAYQVEIDSNFAQRLARRLTDRPTHLPTGSGAAIEAVNLGVHGYGLGVFALQVRDRLAAWHPDAVVLSLFLGNDLHDNFLPIASPAVPRFSLRDGQLVEWPAPDRDLRIWLRDEVLARSSLGRWFWLRVIKSSTSAMAIARAAGMVSTPDLASDAAGQQAHLRAVAARLLRQILMDLRQLDVPVHVLLIPDPFLVHDLAQQHRGVGKVAADDERLQLEALVQKVLQEEDVTFTAPRERFFAANLEGVGVYRGGFGHFTDTAHCMVADLLEAPVRQLLVKHSAAEGLD